MLILDATLVAAAYISAYLLRFDGHIPLQNWVQLKTTLPFVIPLKLFCFIMFGLYKGMWRYTSLADLRNTFKATSLSSIIIVLAILFLYRFHGFSRSVYVIDFVFTFLFVGGIRVAIRLLLADHHFSFWAFGWGKKSSASKLIIVGAGDAGEKVLREIQEHASINMEPVGFFDDDPGKRGKAIHGVPVLGAVDEINKIRTEFDEILIAVPSVRGEKLRRIVSLCEESGKRFRTLPGIWELIEGKVSIKTIRKVHLEDLLDRKEVHLDEEEIRKYLKDKRILITGAAGMPFPSSGAGPSGV